MIAATVVVAIALASWRGRIPGRGATIKASISLVTTDRDDLACASPDTFGAYRCAFRAPGKAWREPPPRADLLAAYYTVNQQLLVIPGLFEQPAVAARYAAEEPRGLPRDLRPRFVATCRFELVGELHHFQTRWLRSGGFNPQDEACDRRPVRLPSPIAPRASSLPSAGCLRSRAAREPSRPTERCELGTLACGSRAEGRFEWASAAAL